MIQAYSKPKKQSLWTTRTVRGVWYREMNYAQGWPRRWIRKPYHDYPGMFITFMPRVMYDYGELQLIWHRNRSVKENNQT